MKINLHIEQVVLDGVPIARHQVPVLRRALEAELTRLLVGEPERRLPSGGATPLLCARMPAARPADASGWGERIAGAVQKVVLA